MLCIGIAFDLFVLDSWKKTPNRTDFPTMPEKASKFAEKIYVVVIKYRDALSPSRKNSPHSQMAAGAAVLKIPMYLDRYDLRSREPFSNDDAVNEMLHHFPGQMLYMDITENMLPLLFLRVRSGF